MDGGTQTPASDFPGSQSHKTWARLYWGRICSQTSAGPCFGVQVPCLQGGERKACLVLILVLVRVRMSFSP